MNKNSRVKAVISLDAVEQNFREMRKNIAELLDTDIKNISVKAQTNEKCGEVGTSKAVVCFASVLVRKED